MVLTGPQLRAARAFLDWSRQDCRDASGVSVETIKAFEHGNTQSLPPTIYALVDTLYAHGIELTEREGLRRRQRWPEVAAA